MAARTLRFSAPDRRRQIMQVATKLFARQGFEGTTTRQIAESARVNEAIIFRHFGSKEDLYWAIIEQECRIPWAGKKLQKKLRDPNAREVFSGIAEDMIRRRTADTSLTRLLFFSALENHRLAYRFFRTHVAQRYEALARYIRGRIRSRRFRRVDPLLAARGFLGMVVYHFLIQELFGGKRYRKFDPKRVSQTLTDIWLRGMLAENGKPSTRRRGSA